ncbi:MAG: hypothetical protein RID91_08990 [Azospirillaceae bacterium]
MSDRLDLIDRIHEIRDEITGVSEALFLVRMSGETQEAVNHALRLVGNAAKRAAEDLDTLADDIEAHRPPANDGGGQ